MVIIYLLITCLQKNCWHIQKYKCVCHVQKRLGTNLRGLKKKAFKDADGKLLKLKWRGKNCLTKSRINMLSSYYGNAIRKNPGDTASMYEATWAVFHHSISTDAVHDHSDCPTGPDTWCKFNRVISEGHHHGTHPSFQKILGSMWNPSLTLISQGLSGGVWFWGNLESKWEL